MDGTDNFETRFLINDLSIKQHLPWVYGGCVGSYGVACAFQPGSTPCLACLFQPPSQVGEMETCDTAGILASVVHVISAHQVTQALRILVGETPSAKILQVDLWSGLWRTIDAEHARQPQCRCCQKGELNYLEGREGTLLTRLCGRDAIQLAPQLSESPDFEQISRRLKRSAHIDRNPYLLRIRVDRYEIALFTDGRSIIRGASDFSEARAVYAKYIGS